MATDATPSKPKKDRSEYFAKYRLENRERHNIASSNWTKNNKERHRAAIKKWRIKHAERIRLEEKEKRKRHFFQTRAKNCVWRNKHGDKNEIANAIFWIWKQQRGLCALTGRKLDSTAQLDHVIPISKGGKNVRENLRWLCKEANQCRDDLLDEDFINLCKEVIQYNQTKCTI